MITRKLTKYTAVGIVCTVFSMGSYPLILRWVESETITYVIATAVNISVSYLAQSIISFGLTPTLARFFKYIYVSLGIILLGNVAYFFIVWLYGSGLVAYYASWVFTSLVSYLSHYRFTYRN